MRPGVFWTLIKKPRWLQILTERKASWSSRAEVGDSSQNIPTIQDDGSHFDESPFYFEWWYFDATFDDSSAISVVIHLTDLIRPASKNGSLNVVVFAKDRSVMRRFVPYPTQAIVASSQRCDVRIGKSRCWSEGESYRIFIEEPDIKIELTFRSVSSGWRPGNGRFLFGDGSAFFSWIVPQLKAEVEGVITLAGKEGSVRGWGYHDHNWGTVSLLDTVQDWSWGRIYFDDYTCVFADIQLSRRYSGARVMPFSVIRGKDIGVSSFLQENEPLDTQRDFLHRPYAVESPVGWHLESDEGHWGLDLILQTQHVMEKSDMLAGNSIRKRIIEKLIAHPYYIRCLVTAKGKLRPNGKTLSLDGHGIYEQITFGRQ